MPALSPEGRSAGLAAAARGQRAELVALAEVVASRSRVEVVEAPAAGSVMVELDTPAGSFCLTEVVVTTCAVRVDGRAGWAAVQGWDDEASLAAAILDAEPALADALAQSALAGVASRHEEEARAVAATRVGT
jgi:alpha-D-ribose 1-methylphosphonate 5-triphosphate synthase subunit PhnG